MSVLLPLFLCSPSVSLPLGLCVSLSLSLSLFLSLCLSHALTPNSIVIDGLRSPRPFPQSCQSRTSFSFVPLRNARSRAAAGASETLQNRLPSVEAESRNNEKLSANSRFLPPALLRTGSFAFRLDVNSPTRCKQNIDFPASRAWALGTVLCFFILCKGKTRRFVLRISPGTREGEGEIAAE